MVQESGLPKIAITLGDPAGIGPEIVAKLLVSKALSEQAAIIVVGGKDVLERGASYVNGKLPVDTQVVTPRGSEPRDYQIGEIQESCGEAAYQALAKAIAMARSGEVDALVTAPLHKQALHLAGHTYPGHTEILSAHCGDVPVALMLIADWFRVVHVTCHTALSDVPALLDVERVERTVSLFDNALRRLDGQPPRLALCALNPHAGEGGLFGREEIDVLRPAVDRCRTLGFDLCGPLPSDSVFPRHRSGEFTGVVVLYHDQGHIPFKLANFHVEPGTGAWSEVCGVNVTLGLPIVRTSVDHGTAFDIAGTGRASDRSLRDAVEVAIRLATDRSAKREACS